MLSNYEHIIISAVRYALSRRTYIVGTTVDYVIDILPELSKNCKEIIIRDIEQPLGGYGDECDKVEWMHLLAKLKEDINNN